MIVMDMGPRFVKDLMVEDIGTPQDSRLMNDCLILRRFIQIGLFYHRLRNNKGIDE